MNYEVIEIKGKEYKLRLRAIDQISLKNKLGKSLLEVVSSMQESDNPLEAFDLELLIIILTYALKAHHKEVKEKEVYDLFDQYVDEGNTMFDLFQVIMKVFAVSGVLPDVTGLMNELNVDLTAGVMNNDTNM